MGRELKGVLKGQAMLTGYMDGNYSSDCISNKLVWLVDQRDTLISTLYTVSDMYVSYSYKTLLIILDLFLFFIIVILLIGE